MAEIIDDFVYRAMRKSSHSWTLGPCVRVWYDPVCVTVDPDRDRGTGGSDLYSEGGMRAGLWL